MATDKIIDTPYSMQQIINEVLARIPTDGIGSMSLCPSSTTPSGFLGFDGTTYDDINYSELVQYANNNNLFGANSFLQRVNATQFKTAKADSPIFTKFGNNLQLYVSPQVAPVANTPTIINHGLNLDNNQLNFARNNVKVNLVCAIAEGGYSIGDYSTGYIVASAGGIYNPIIPFLTTNTIQYNTTTQINMQNKATGANFVSTLANWRYELSFTYPKGTSTIGTDGNTKYIIKAKNIAGVDPIVYNANAATLGGLPSSAFAALLGNPSNAFQMAQGLLQNNGVNLGQLAGLLTNRGYLKIPVWDSNTNSKKDLILQWGRTLYNSGGASQIIILPFAFPNNMFAVIGNWEATTYTYGVTMYNLLPNSFQVSSPSTGYNGLYIGWFALGY